MRANVRECMGSAMPTACRILGVAASLAAWLVTTGLAWDGLQLAAWAKMAGENARTMPVDAAVRTAVTGAPCKHCRAVRAARQGAEQATPATGLPGKSIADLPAPADTTFAFLAPDQAWPRPVNHVAMSLPQAVAVPPPRGDPA